MTRALDFMGELGIQRPNAIRSVSAASFGDAVYDPQLFFVHVSSGKDLYQVYVKGDLIQQIDFRSSPDPLKEPDLAADDSLFLKRADGFLSILQRSNQLGEPSICLCPNGVRMVSAPVLYNDVPVEGNGYPISSSVAFLPRSGKIGYYTSLGKLPTNATIPAISKGDARKLAERIFQEHVLKNYDSKIYNIAEGKLAKKQSLVYVVSDAKARLNWRCDFTIPYRAKDKPDPAHGCIEVDAIDGQSNVLHNLLGTAHLHMSRVAKFAITDGRKESPLTWGTKPSVSEKWMMEDGHLDFEHARKAAEDAIHGQQKDAVVHIWSASFSYQKGGEPSLWMLEFVGANRMWRVVLDAKTGEVKRVGYPGPSHGG